LQINTVKLTAVVTKTLHNNSNNNNNNNNNNTLLHKNTKHVHVLGLEGHMHDTNTSPKTNCSTTIEENIYKATVEWNKGTITISANIL